MFESLFESAPDALIATDHNGLIRQVNAEAERMFGYARSELAGQVVEILVPDRLRRQHVLHREGYYTEARLRPMGAGLELYGSRKNGTEVPIEISLSPIETKDGTLVISAIRDVSERRKAEETRSHLHALVESSEDAIIGQTPERVIVSWNAGAEAMYGYTAAEMIGRPISDIACLEQQGEQATLAGKVARGGGIQRYEALRTRKNGSQVPVSVTNSPIRNASGKLLGVSSIDRDITEQKALEDQLRRKNVELEEQNRLVQEATRLKSEFLANMSHELRTPLNAIIGFTELMHNEKVGPVSLLQKEYLGDVLSSSRHLLQLINDILDLSKVEAGKMEFQPEPADLSRLVESVQTTLRALAAARQIRVDTEIDPAVTGAVIDTGKFKQVLYNFVSNALKFTPEEGRLCIRIRSEGAKRFRLEVEDTGIGIQPENIPMLFTEFRQLSSGAGKKYAGTGLGLALTRRIVEAQGGTVGVSTTPGKGSVFYAVLPLVAGIGLLDESTCAETPAPAGADAHRVLVVEENAGEREWLARTLAVNGYAVETAKTGAEAIERCRCETYDAITLDPELPDINGLEVLRTLRAESMNKHTPVVVVTVAGEKGKAIGVPVHDLLAKPVSAEDLLDSLKRAQAAPGETVLVVDDDPRDLKLAAELLRQAGYRPVCKLDGESALIAAAQERPVAVVLDLQIPNMDGLEFLHRFRSAPGTGRTPVIVWTHKDPSPDERACIQRSAQALVAKGAGGAILIEQLQAHLPVTRGLQALARLNETGPVKETAPKASTGARTPEK